MKVVIVAQMHKHFSIDAGILFMILYLLLGPY